MATPERFFRRGVSKVFFAAAVVDLQAPTTAEFTAATELTDSISSISGFSLANNPISTPDLATSFDSQIDGPDSAQDSGFNFYDDKVDTVIRTALAKGTNGFVILCPYGQVATKRCEVWPVRSTGFNDMWSLDANAAEAAVTFAVTAVPVQDAVVPGP